MIRVLGEILDLVPCPTRSVWGALAPLFLEVFMNTKRRFVNKGRSAGQFRHNVSRTHHKNMAMKPMRGGWRL